MRRPLHISSSIPPLQFLHGFPLPSVFAITVIIIYIGFCPVSSSGYHLLLSPTVLFSTIFPSTPPRRYESIPLRIHHLRSQTCECSISSVCYYQYLPSPCSTLSSPMRSHSAREPSRSREREETSLGHHHQCLSSSRDPVLFGGNNSTPASSGLLRPAPSSLSVHFRVRPQSLHGPHTTLCPHSLSALLYLSPAELSSATTLTAPPAPSSLVRSAQKLWLWNTAPRIPVQYYLPSQISRRLFSLSPLKLTVCSAL